MYFRRCLGIICLASVASMSRAAEPAPQFLRDIAPILDRNGCSTAQCHGKFGGRGGLQVSLLTLSPEDDYEPLVYGAHGRRINFADPAHSLILLKSIGQLHHGGGPRFAVGSPDYTSILRWIKAGAPFSEKEPRLARLEIRPAKIALTTIGKAVPTAVIATMTDGSVRDVTKQSTFQSTNAAVLSVGSNGSITGLRWGGGAILARYLGSIAASFATLPQKSAGPYPSVPAVNVVDKLVFENLRRLNVVPSDLSTDYEFVRRVTLDTAGRLPTPEETQSFVGDKSPGKRAALIDALLSKPEFADYRAMRLADLLRINPQKFNGGNMGDRSADLLYEWVWKSVAENKPWNTFVRELISAEGSGYNYGPANFYRIERSANDRMENIGQAFLGVRMSCARCHKHPFDRWTTDNYWNFAAFTGKVGIRGGNLYQEEIIYHAPGAETVNASVNGRNRGKVAPATFLGDSAPAQVKGDPVDALAGWITSPTNPFFARATVNRLWSYYFGRGVVHPVDDMRSTTPENVPGLLDALAHELVSHNYDIKHVIRLILNSRTYQLSSLPNKSNMADDRYFSRIFPRPMPAQVLLDMVNAATGAREDFSSFPERSRAVQAALPIGNDFLGAFGQSHRQFLADIDPKLEPNLVQTLLMINSPYIENKIRSGSVSTDVAKAPATDLDVVNKLYLRALNRPPSAHELTKAAAAMKTATNRAEAAQDLLWALLSSREFFFNH